MSDALHFILALFLAATTVVFFAKAMRLGFLLAPVDRLARKVGTVNALLCALLVALMAHVAVTKNGTNTLDGAGSDLPSTNAPPMLSAPHRAGANAPATNAVPAWFTALGYNPLDTDGDGIPNCWERWTHTNPRSADANLDPDGDGLDNLAEFMNQCDPLLADTDGDGFPDGLEVARAAQGDTHYDPLQRADFTGATGAWTAGYPAFADANGDGFPDTPPVPTATDGNFDVTLVVSSSRTALLSWGEADGLVLPPCTNLAVSLRLDGTDITRIRLAAAPEGEAPDGLWKARVRIDWTRQREQESELNRVRLGDGRIVECGEMELSYIGDAAVPRPRLFASPGSPSSTGTPAAIGTTFTPFWLSLTQVDLFCPEHGGGTVVEAVYTNLPPVFQWGITSGHLEPHGDTALASSYGPESIVTCTVTNGVEYTRLLLTARLRLSVAEQCHFGETNIVGAAWTSTHNPTNATDHIPAKTETVRTFSTPLCRIATNVTYTVGWTHDELLMHIRNLVMLTTGNDEEDGIDHCMGFKWMDGGAIDLKGLLADCCDEIADRLVFKVNGEICADGKLRHPNKQPDTIFPAIYNVSIHDENDGNALDRAWFVIYSLDTETDFSSWQVAETNLTWTLSLPKPFASLSSATNTIGDIVASPVTHVIEWEKAEVPGAYMHHNACWEMRSKPDADGHGHQATYDDAGNLITSTIAAGTADKVSPGSWYHTRTTNHRDQDVLPYLMALQMDGNPVWPNNKTGRLKKVVPSRLNRPCVFIGDYTSEYLRLRPTTPTGVQY